MLLQNLSNLVDLVTGECDRSIVSDASHDALLRGDTTNLRPVSREPLRLHVLTFRVLTLPWVPDVQASMA
jgi:hypothetical protein